MKKYRRKDSRSSQILIIGIAVLVVVLIVGIIIACFNKSKNSDKPGNTQIDVEKVTDATETQTEEEEVKEPFAPKETDSTAAIGDELESIYAIVVDEQDGTVVAQKNAHERMYPASMTKVMTVLVAAEEAEKSALEDGSANSASNSMSDNNKSDSSSTDVSDADKKATETDENEAINNKLSELVTITREATDYSYVHDCSTTGFLDGEQVPLRDVFNGTILPSGGESAYQLALYTSGSMEAFVELMNKKAEELGISETTHFTNPVGIYDDNNYSTAYDMAIIMQAAMSDEICREVLSNHTYSTAVTEQHPESLNISNLFLRRIEDHMTSGTVIGAKTGFVNQSGNCAVSYEEAASGKTYICVTAGATSGWHCIYNHVDLYNAYAK